MVRNGDSLGFWPILGTKRNSGPGPKSEKHNFPELGALLGKKSVCPRNFSLKLCNFFTFCVLAHRTPRGGKSQNTGFLGHFGLGQPLGTYRNSGPKTEKCNILELGAFLEKKSVRPKSFSQKLRNFFAFCVFAVWTPRGGKSQNTGFLGPFGLAQPLGT